MFYKTFVT